MNTIIRNAMMAALLAACQLAQASDLAREKRWADEIVDAIVDGDAVQLNDGSHDFLGIYTEAPEKTQRGVILMHGTGVHPNWQQVIYPLRVGLPEHGWSTLSIQMPILAADVEGAPYAPLYSKEVPARIDSAVKYLQGKGIKQIVLIGHSQGTLMGAYYLRKHSKNINALVTIGMTCNQPKDPMNAATSLKSIHMPVLDLYGSNDFKEVLDSRSECLQAAKAAGNKQYTVEKVEGANHFFDGKDKELLDIVTGWLNSLPQ